MGNPQPSVWVALGVGSLGLLMYAVQRLDGSWL